jgi:hypothetical protein
MVDNARRNRPVELLLCWDWRLTKASALTLWYHYSGVLKAVDQNVVRTAAAYREANGFLTISVITIMEVIQGLQKVGDRIVSKPSEMPSPRREFFPLIKTPLTWRDRLPGTWTTSGDPSADATQ